MKYPKYSSLDEKQKEIYSAPLDGTTMVIGPPGSGKTVVGAWRAVRLVKLTNGQRQKHNFIMFNKVLKQFASISDTDDDEFEKTEQLKTLHSWLYGFWDEINNSKAPEIRKFEFDYGEMIRQLSSDSSCVERANWGHLIIDEGQDFPKQLYEFLRIVQRLWQLSQTTVSCEMPAITVLADDNQRITSNNNSTIDEIRKQLEVDEDRFYSLTKNYRNTRQIAEFANRFFVGGIQTGMGTLPKRIGEKPKIKRVLNTDEAIEVVASYIKNNTSYEVGVFLPTKDLAKEYFHGLSDHFKSTDTITVQRYWSEDKKVKAEDLTFTRSTVTILCHASAKGIEFDAVFLPELQDMPSNDGDVNSTKMLLYVLTTRARSFLQLLFCGSDSAEEFKETPFGKFLPYDLAPLEEGNGLGPNDPPPDPPSDTGEAGKKGPPPPPLNFRAPATDVLKWVIAHVDPRDQKISCTCPGCDRKLPIPSAKFLGKTVTCPHCQAKFPLEAPASDELPESKSPGAWGKKVGGTKKLKGGMDRKSGGDEFGLKW